MLRRDEFSDSHDFPMKIFPVKIFLPRNCYGGILGRNKIRNSGSTTKGKWNRWRNSGHESRVIQDDSDRFERARLIFSGASQRPLPWCRTIPSEFSRD